MSSNALPSHDGCHYAYEGYRTLGTHMARLVLRDLHGLPLPGVDSPNPASAVFTTPSRDEILLTFQNQEDRIVWQDGCEADFRVGGQPIVVGGQVTGNAVLLRLSSPAKAAILSYLGHAGPGPSLTNGVGVGALAFKIPID